MYGIISFLLTIFTLNGAHELPGGDNVEEVTMATWNEKVLPEKIALVEFYSSLCSMCRKFAPDYAKVGDYLHGVIPILRISLEENRAKFVEMGVDTVPTIILFRPDNREVFRSTKTPASIVDWVISLIPILTLESPIALQQFFHYEEEVYPARVVVFHTTESPPRIPNRIKKSIFATYQITDGNWKEDVRLPCFGVFKAQNKTSERQYYSFDDPFFQQAFIESEKKDEGSKAPENDDSFMTPVIVLVAVFFIMTCVILCCAVRGKPKKNKNKKKGLQTPELNSVLWNDDGDVKHQD